VERSGCRCSSAEQQNCPDDLSDRPGVPVLSRFPERPGCLMHNLHGFLLPNRRVRQNQIPMCIIAADGDKQRPTDLSNT
jgi:hypothetical protein